MFSVCMWGRGEEPAVAQWLSTTALQSWLFQFRPRFIKKGSWHKAIAKSFMKFYLLRQPLKNGAIEINLPTYCVLSK